jgi:hypothetical protein
LHRITGFIGSGADVNITALPCRAAIAAPEDEITSPVHLARLFGLLRAVSIPEILERGKSESEHGGNSANTASDRPKRTHNVPLQSNQRGLRKKHTLRFQGRRG